MEDLLPNEFYLSQNHPNPFTEKTHFTFELRGVVVPQEFKIKVFTVAGRLIRIIDVPPSDLRIGFNTIAWDGRDQDGDEIANGLYFYKIVSKVGDEIKTITQKLAKVKRICFASSKRFVTRVKPGIAINVSLPQSENQG